MQQIADWLKQLGMPGLVVGIDCSGHVGPRGVSGLHFLIGGVISQEYVYG